MSESKRKKMLALFAGIAAGLLIAFLFLLSTIERVKSPKVELQELQIQEAKLRIELLKRKLNGDVLTVDDLSAI